MLRSLVGLLATATLAIAGAATGSLWLLAIAIIWVALGLWAVLNG